jgi:hypothetical protein
MGSARSWKGFESAIARLLGGKRFWSNSGEALDCEGPSYVAQCKLVKLCSLETLTCLVETVERQAALRNKAGVVAIKLRRGRGRESPILMVVTAATWERMHGTPFNDDDVESSETLINAPTAAALSGIEASTRPLQ